MAKKIVEKKMPKFISAYDFPKYVSRKEFIEIGHIKKTYNYITISGRKLSIIKKFFPILVYINQFLLSLSIVSLIVLFHSLSQNESPTLFASINNGKLICSNEPIDINNGEKKIGRETRKYFEICESLENFDGSRED